MLFQSAYFIRELFRNPKQCWAEYNWKGLTRSVILMLMDISRVQSVRLVTGDVRKFINGLIAFIYDDFKMDSYANALYLFCGKSKQD